MAADRFPEVLPLIGRVIFTAVTIVGVLIAATAPRWDTTLAACALCFVRGWWCHLLEAS